MQILERQLDRALGKNQLLGESAFKGHFKHTRIMLLVLLLQLGKIHLSRVYLRCAIKLLCTQQRFTQQHSKTQENIKVCFKFF